MRRVSTRTFRSDLSEIPCALRERHLRRRNDRSGTARRATRHATTAAAAAAAASGRCACSKPVPWYPTRLQRELLCCKGHLVSTRRRTHTPERVREGRGSPPASWSARSWKAVEARRRHGQPGHGRPWKATEKEGAAGSCRTWLSRKPKRPVATVAARASSDWAAYASRSSSAAIASSEPAKPSPRA